MAPVDAQRRWILGMGAAIFMGCGLIGLYIASRKILHPLKVIQVAARHIAETAHLGNAEAGSDDGSGSEREAATRALVDDVRGLRTHDEFQDLAGDFGLMAERVLHYHEQLEREIAEKTDEMAQDRQLARDFQQALLPQDYPRVPTGTKDGRIALNFSHTYSPAFSVSGDFFDVTKLSDHHAGVFIADVMGHGARSALVSRSDGKVEQLPFQAGEHPALGLINGMVFEETRRAFVEGDVFLLFTDGATEAISPGGEQFSEARIMSVLREHCGLGASGLTDAMMHALHRHMDSVVSADDICLVAVEAVGLQPQPVSNEGGPGVRNAENPGP
jgi:serine phosphatase RsbU (regulator of sigma subunit)